MTIEVTGEQVRPARLDPRKFHDPVLTARGERRAVVAPGALATLWFNTGTLCNLTCRNCYIESSPTNDRLAYLSLAEVETYLDEIARERLGTRLVGFTGGEPFMNPALPDMLAAVLGRGLQALVLTNAMRPMGKHRARLLALRRFGPALTIRVSIDHPDPAVHQAERGPRSFAPTLAGLHWLIAAGFRVAVAGRSFSGEPEPVLRTRFADFFAAEGIPLDAARPEELVLFPEMDATADVPEITEACWGILHRAPEEVMCASSRMVVKRRDAAAPTVVACTLLPYDPRFELGPTLRDALVPVALNHPHCARFCVLGGAACSRG
jgi:uncharacterized Fe-S cluster-containing radical SAM superfamily protein